jgi:hypothetical protein
MMAPMHRACLVLFALVTVACADRTALLVEVSSPDLGIPGDIDGLRIRAWTPLDAMFDQTFPVNAGWPHSLTILPAAGEGLGQVFVEVTGTHGGDFVVRRVVLTNFEPGATRRVQVSLLRSCVDVRCAEGVDCNAGTCMGAGLDAGVDGGSDGGLDAAPPMFDADIDGGVLDAGGDDAEMTDGGAADAFAIDAFSVDAAGTFDAGLDSGVHDAGTDAAVTDVGIDTGGPIDSGGPVDAGSDCTGIACRGTVVISELTTQGPAGGLDEFVELYNRGSGTATVGGCTIAYHSASGSTRTVRLTLAAGTTIPSHHYFLAVGSMYAGTVTPDISVVERWTTGASDAGGTITLECGGSTMIVDRVGYGTATLAEGAPVTPTMPPSGSYERKALASSTVTSMSTGGTDALLGNAEDTDHNDVDLVVRTMRDPQSSASAAEP